MPADEYYGNGNRNGSDDFNAPAAGFSEAEREAERRASWAELERSERADPATVTRPY
jgi:hypothetical protein